MTARKPDHRAAAGLLAAALLAGALASRTPSWRAPGEGAAQASPDSAAALLERRLAAPGAAGLLSPAPVRALYARRGYAPAWSGTESVSPGAGALLEALRAAEAEGLRPADYRPDRIEAAMGRLRASPGGRLDAAARADLDLLLSDAFLTYGTHLGRGRVEPKSLHAGWALGPRSVDAGAALEAALRSGRVEEALASLAPRTPEYAALRGALRRYRALEARGGWPSLPAGPTLRPGESGEAVAVLRARLAAEADLAPSESPALYDAALEAAVRAFQRERALEEDAVVGPATRAALNVPAGRRVEAIALSLERLRWLPDDLGRRHVRVSIPAFELAVVEDGRRVLEMRIVGGRPDWRTPMLSARMTSVALSPYWNIPTSIAEQEVLPKARRDPTYLSRNGIRWVSGADGPRLRQDPGPLNPLGGVKFLFPNRFNVYLHDTPAKQLFAEPQRAFSHGCMRVERPLELAAYVLGPLGWSREEVAAAMARGAERTVRLEEPIPVHVLYATAWVDGAGRVQLRGDLYGHDARLAAALAGRAGAATEPAGDDCAAVVE